MFMLNLSLSAVARGPVPIQEEVPADHDVWAGSGLSLQGPVRLDLEARSVGEGVLVRGEIVATLASECRRCLEPVTVRMRDTLDLLFEPLTGDEEAELGGEVYAMPRVGDALDLGPAIREQLLLRVPGFVLCADSCRGLCPQCGVNRNEKACECVPERAESPWTALKDIKFD
jgi:uncharacterized protein